MSPRGTAVLASLASSTSRADVAVRGVTAMHWAPPTASATYEQGSASASLASPGSVVTDVRPTTSDLALKAANRATVTLRVRVPCSAGRTVAASARKALWGPAATSVRRTISTTGRGQAVRSVLHVTD